MWLSNFLLEVNTQAFNMVSLYKELYRTEKTRGRSFSCYILQIKFNNNIIVNVVK